MKVVFRVDANHQMGTGHFTRCLTLADALKLNKNGATIRFVCRHIPVHFIDMLEKRGYQLAQLSSTKITGIKDDLKHAAWLDVNQLEDAKDTKSVLSSEYWDWLIVDNYALDARWESKMRPITRNIMVIDDLADRVHDCDFLLDQNLYADMGLRYQGKVPDRCRLLLGPRYALLRDEFRLMHEQLKPRNGFVKRILVFLGGMDADNYTGQVIEALSEINISEIQIDVVIGAQHPCCEQIKAMCAKYEFICHIQTDKMAELMANADLAIGAGGSATWERCCVGLPSLAICIADNQQKQIADAALAGLLYSPEIKGKLQSAIEKHVNALIENNYLRQSISHTAMDFVDGRGAFRVTRYLKYSDITIRKAAKTDLGKLFEWRNHPYIRSMSKNTELISWENHQAWFEAVTGSQDKELLIGQIGEMPIGVVRFDLQGSDAEVSIYLIPDTSNNSGQGQNLLLASEQWLKVNRSDVSYIRASVLGGNKRSQRLFSKAGYQVEIIHYLKDF